MSDNSQKTHLGEALNAASLQKALNQVHGIAKCLPATAGGIAGSIMGAMNFETSGTSGPPKASIPHFGPEYVRYPTQQGDKGVHIGQHTNIGNMSGQGPSGGSALDNSNSNTGASSSGVFMPIANTNWEKAPSPNMLCHYGVMPQQQQGQSDSQYSSQLQQDNQGWGTGIYDQVFSKALGSLVIQTKQSSGGGGGQNNCTATLQVVDSNGSTTGASVVVVKDTITINVGGTGSSNANVTITIKKDDIKITNGQNTSFEMKTDSITLTATTINLVGTVNAGASSGTTPVALCGSGCATKLNAV
jgi:hypothetical protein